MTAIMGIDIVDTPGDWVQLFLMAAFVFGLVLFVSYRITTPKSGNGIIALGVYGLIFWPTVYDYDLVLGGLVGCIALIIFGVIQTRRFPDEKSYENPYSEITLTGFLLGLMWLAKIIFFFKS